MAEKEYIERGALLELIAERNRNTCNGTMSCLQMKRMVESVPAACVVPVVHGEWIEKETEIEIGDMKLKGTFPACSECGLIFVAGRLNTEIRYCSNCGAKMDGGKDDR